MQKNWVTLASSVVATVYMTAEPRAQQSSWRTPWDYAGERGAEHWGDLDPLYATCKLGREQSPIDIRNATKAELPAIRFEYKSAPLRNLINNGYSIRVNYHVPGSGGSLLVGTKRYQLTQFHFHHPSEEHIQGMAYDMAIHLMHEASDGEVAGVAVLLKVGAANTTVQSIWDHLPATLNHEEDFPGTEINPADLVPRETSYYTYKGSQTAPPCTEGVRWIVLKTPVDVSAEQIQAFARLYPHDVRPLQPLNGRVVLESR